MRCFLNHALGNATNGVPRRPGALPHGARGRCAKLSVVADCLKETGYVQCCGRHVVFPDRKYGTPILIVEPIQARISRLRRQPFFPPRIDVSPKPFVSAIETVPPKNQRARLRSRPLCEVQGPVFPTSRCRLLTSREHSTMVRKVCLQADPAASDPTRTRRETSCTR